MAAFKRTLGLAECVFFGVGSILGAGIYTLIGKVAGYSGNMIWLAFLIAAFTALFTAFSYAELSSAFPSAGGEYTYARKAFGEKTGLALGGIISLNGIISGATVSLGFGGYFSDLLHIPEMIAALGIIGIIFLVNASGIRQSSVMNIIFTIIEAGGLVFMIIASVGKTGGADITEMPEGGLNMLFIASALAFYAFIGFEDIVKLAQEAKEPEKNIPRALFIATIIVVAMYLLVSVCAVNALSPQDLAASKSPMSDIVGQSYGKTGIVIMSVIALFATSNTILSNMIGSSRVLHNMAEESKSMKFFARVSTKRKTPVGALVFILGTMCAFALIGKIETVARIATIFIFITFIVINLAVIVLRKQQPKLKRPYEVPLNIKRIPVISLMGILFTLFLLVYNIYSFFES